MNNLVATRAVFQSPHVPMRLETVSVPVPKDGEAVVEIELCTICGSDLHTIEGRRASAGEQVLGHEIIGKIVRLSDANPVRDFAGHQLQVGDRVTWSLHASCGQCFWCKHRLSQKCEQLFKYGHAAVSDAYPVTGGMATHCQLRAGTAILRIPQDMDARLACPANCATATVAAAFRQAGGCRDGSVLISGAGMLGLTATAWAREHGARDVVVLEPNPKRAELAQRFGAHAVCGDASAARDLFSSMTANRGADASFDFSGHPDAVQATIDLVRIGGQAVWVGSVFPSEPIAVCPEVVVRRCLHIVGVHNYLAEDLLAAVEFLSRFGQEYPFVNLVSATFGLSEINEAVPEAIQTGHVRVALDPSR